MIKKEEIYEMMKQEEFVYENAQEEKRLTKLLF